MYKNMYELLEEQTMGQFKLEKFEITDKNRMFRSAIPTGKYVRLIDTANILDGCVMSDTPMEKRTNSEFIIKANGDVLIGGLGIGMIILPIQEKENVKSITVLEKNKDIIELVAPQLPLNDKVKIIHSDVFTHEFERGRKFDSIYFDIWNYVNSDVYEEMKALKKKYRKNLRIKKNNPNSFMKCWAEYEARYNKTLY